jgi:AcrR family transcriptional regulator
METNLSNRSNCSFESTNSPSLRERGKLEKRSRIVQAARQVFIEKGYDAATTREIAMLANVGIGTLFIYAKEKRELLMMVVNDELDVLSDRVPHNIDPSASTIDQITAFFHARYVYWAAEPRLARPVLRETFDFLNDSEQRGEETTRFYARRSKTVQMLTALIRTKQNAGEVAANISPDLIASLFMTIYLAEQRRWLSQELPEVEGGIAHLREMLELATRGILPAG